MGNRLFASCPSYVRARLRCKAIPENLVVMEYDA